MPIPFPSRQFNQSGPSDTTGVPPSSGDPNWRCTQCDKLLGVYRDGRLHLRFSRGHEYFVSFPVTATCRGCGTLNRTSDPAS